MDSESDSEGEELGIIRPTLIRELRNVLEEYPDDGQILKEMIQNAEDAGATLVNFVSDTREFNHDVSPTDIKRTPFLKFFKGPALYAFNNAMFSDRDWQGIRMIHTSIKEADPLKVGRFGLGFKSVFHMTDCLAIISGNYLLYMDPFKGENRCCVLKKLARIKSQERQCLLEGLSEIFGVGEEMFQSGHFPGTMFWFPLRQKASELSNIIYTADKINDLWNAFKMEASGILLFLKKIETVGLYTRRQGIQLSLDFQVGLAASCLESVRRENSTFIEAIMAAGGQIPDREVWNSLIKEVEMSDDHSGQSVIQREKWLVVNYHPGQMNLSPQLAELCEDPQLSYKPYVSLAVPIEGQTNFQSQIFCFLPLPLESRSPTGLPVHVNGFFALSQNRRHLKWPTADQLSHQAHMEPSLRWNRLLVEQLLPACYAMLLTKARELFGENPVHFYSTWPDLTRVTDRWQPLVRPLFVSMATKPVFYTEGGQWVELSKALLSTLPSDITDDVKGTVHKVYVMCQENLIVLPQNVLEGLSLSGCLSTVAITTPQRLSRLLQSCLSQFEGHERCHLLAYLCDQKDFSLLEGLQLLPLQDGSFGAFTTEPSPTFFCQDCDIRRFPGLENHFCSCELPHDLRQHLHDIAVSGLFSVRQMEKTDVCHLLINSIQLRFGQQEPCVSVDDHWLQDVWHFLNNNFSDSLQNFLFVPLMPLLENCNFILKPLLGSYVCGQVNGMDPLTDSLITCLKKLGITVLSHLPDYVIRHPQVLGQLVQWPSPQGLLLLLSHISKGEITQRAIVLSFNGSSTDEDRACLIKLLDDCRDIVLNINLQKLLQQLNLFSCLPDRTITSIACVRAIAPEHLPPVPVPRQMLVCQESRDRRVALQLGGQVESLQDISREILLNMQPGREGYSLEQKQEFMKFFVDELLNEKSLHYLAKSVKFLTTLSMELKAVGDLYDPCNKLLKEVFSDDAFPHGEDDFIDKLRKLGLKDENQVTSEEFLQVAELLNASHDHPASIRRAQSLWTLLTSQISRLDSRALHELSHFRCLPALHAKSMPDSYPCELPAACPEPALVSPRDVYPYHYLALVGSVAPVADEKLSSHVVMQTVFKQELSVETVLGHLGNIIKYYNTCNNLKCRTQLNAIYGYFNSNKDNGELLTALKETPCLLVESEAIFLKPSCFWIEDNTDDIVLRPYRYRMSQEMILWQNLFAACGARVCQDSSLLLEVLSEIQKNHLHTTSEKQTKRDLNLVVQILESLKDCPAEYRREVILPVAHCEQSGLRFRPAVECTVGDTTWLMTPEFQVEDDDEVTFVHPNVPVSTALALGALGMMDRALDETEDIDYDYYQGEPLTTRLHNLLEDSYTDGFSIPKELIQNADDAGARQVKFLLDERQNEDCREHLIHPNMASLQGPALWVFNDATFSDQDFANIIKLGAGTKREDASKVGKFGLGFNAVYNITDVPSFISRNIVAFFDPHRKQLPRKSLGMKIDISLAKNQRLLKTVPSQFRPYEGVLGCSLQRENSYAGTLFRLPFRSEEQAALSDIKKDSYFLEKRRKFVAMLIERAGNLLLFTQKVKTVEVFYLSPDAKSPNSMTCLMSVTRKEQLAQQRPHRGLEDHTEGILKFCTQSFEEFFQTRSDAPDIRITEDVAICVEVSPEAKATCNVDSCQSQTEWRITWASGTNQSARLALANKDQGFVPLASAAVPIDGTKLLKINNCPFGFYQQGRLFCFLPLPEQIEQPLLPVHLNGTFALTSSRRNLVTITEENIDNKGGDWNSALMSDAVCRAYLLLLESLHDTVGNDHTSYYELWPRSENGLSLVSNFYTCLVNVQFHVFPSQTGWLSFEKARFFTDSFRHCPVGDSAFEVVLEFWDDQTSFVDIPHEVYKTFLKTPQKKIFIEKCLSEDEFYEKAFFPNINSSFWKTPEKAKIRDSLTLHAIVKGSDRVKKLVSIHACIPCQASQELKTPNQLVHPHREAAALFLPADGRFPQTGIGLVSFCQPDCLQTLTSLGMATDELEWKDIILRANSVKDLLALNKDKSFERAQTLIDYLAGSSINKTRMSLCPTDVIQELSVTEFLPVLKKPADWPFLWFDDDLEPRLAAPCQLYHSDMTNLVSCTQKIFASSTASTFRFKSSKRSRREVLESLKVVTLDQPIYDPAVDAVLNQLLSVADHYESHSQTFIVSNKTGKICRDIYFFLQICIRSDQAEKYKRLITEKLKSEKIIWTGSHFCHPSVLAFTMKLSCPPYLQEVSAQDKANFKDLFQFLGVKEKFGTQDMLGVIDKMTQDVGNRRLSDEEVELFCRAAQLFCSARQETPQVGILDSKLVFLPDREGCLKCVDNLCLDDTSRLKPLTGMYFIHEKFSPEVAKALGVKTKNSTILQKHMKIKSFGQSEKLTNRIKRLLLGYTCDVSIFKEFIQNSDDAGATEIRFIKDFRKLGTDSVPDGWKELQGPALCVYNNADFTSKDIEGIQSLGEGSKGEEMMKTGQFGVGFNAVYHITDVPSFWTRRDGKEQVICVCDPCRIIPNDFHEPGMELEDIDTLKEEYPDMVDGYLGNTFDKSQPATLFRLPLRTKWMTAKSSINKEQMTQHNVSKLLMDFMKEASTCLLFLNNLKKIGIYSTKDGRTLEKEYEVEMVIDEENSFKKEAFYRFLKEEGEKMIDDDLNFDIRHILFPDTVLSFSLKDSQGVQEDWIQVSKAGFLDANLVSEKLQEDWRKEHFRLLPRGGVAVKVKRTEQPISGLSLLQNIVRSLICKPEKLCSRVFCSLPLPVETDLPVHINGHFALEHESRRNLWAQQGDSKTEWNRLICTKVIAPAYIKALEQVKVAWFGQKQRENEVPATTTAKLHEFHYLFPTIPITESPFWSPLVEAFYQQMLSGCHSLLPMTKAGSNSLSWTSVWKENGFAGYFTRPPGCTSAPPFQSVQPQQSQREETVSDKHLSELLKRLNMKIVDVPCHVYTALTNYGADKFQEATPSAVLLFLKSCTSKTSDSCTLKNLPQPLTDLELNENDVLRLVEFVKKSPSFLSEIVGLPLCLLQSGFLHAFSLQQQPFVTEYHDLLPMLSKEFLHGCLVKIFKSFLNNDCVVVKTFDIEDLAERLPHCLHPTLFRTGRPCLLNKFSLPHETWLHNLWNFLQSRLKHVDKDSQISEALKCLNEWSLIPCKLARQGECFLYPVRDREKVLFLPHARLILSDQTLENTVMNILQNLPVPILDDFIVFQRSFAERLVGSVCKFESVVHILRSVKGIISFCQNDARSMLSYFAAHLGELRKQDNCNYLREIPVFCTIGGHTTSIGSKTALLLPKEIPQDGLDSWSLATKTTLLDPDSIPEEVCQLLGLDKSSNLHMIFWRRLLSTLIQLPQEAIDLHIAYIRQSYSHSLEIHEVGDLFNILSHTPFIRNHAARMCKPSEFYSPFNIVFLQMCDGNKFPPLPYCEVQWSDFMEKAGMVKDVTLEMFVSFAKQVEAEGTRGLSETTLKKSSTLVKHLFGEGHLRYSGLLNDVCNIRFVRPWSFEEERKNKGLEKICPPFVTNRLVSFSESCRSCHWPLLWSETAIVHPHDDPDMYMRGGELQKALKQLKFKNEVPMDSFKQHVARVCKVLNIRECDLLSSSDGRKKVEWLFEQIYTFLKKLNQIKLNFFNTLPVVFDSYNCRVLYPEQVVINLSSNEAIDGWLFRAPTNYDKFFRLFQSLGVAQTLTADHYSRVLAKLASAYPDQTLEGDTLMACIKAVQGLFRCLGDSRQMNERVLYLPNQQLCLKPATSLIVNDDKNLSKRLQSCSDRFFADFKQLGIESLGPRDMSYLLPERHRMAQLSQSSVEVIPYSIVKMGSRENESQKKLSSVEFVNGVTRLVNHKHVTAGTTMKTNTRQKIRDAVKKIQVVEIEKLHTVLVIDNSEVPGSESYHRIHLHERYPQHVFVDRRARVSDKDVAVTLADVLIKVLDEDLRKFRSLLIAMLRCPDIQDLLDQNNITYFRQSDTCRPGSYVNVDDLCLLNNNIASIFMESEDAAMEVADPFIDTEEKEVPQVSKEPRLVKEHVACSIDKMSSSFTDLPAQTHQVFIYVRVIERLGVEGRNIGQPCCMSYRIDIGCGHTMEVSAVRLYKIPTTYDTEDTSGFMLVSANQTAHCDPRTDNVVVNEAKQCLEVALPLLKDRLLQLGLLKRLCLQWHPYLSTKSVYSQVLELIKQTTLSLANQPMPSAVFFDRVFERGQLYASQIVASRRANSDFNHQRKRRNPQPGEGQRWLRQAFADLRTARITPEGNNWHCLMCHLAAEKALKAVLFHKDADDKLLHPEETAELTTLAQAVGNKELIQVVEILVGITGERRRMSYPFVQWAPHIPALLYTSDTARSACSQAETILTIAASLMK